jgi:hypothetical protein
MDCNAVLVAQFSKGKCRHAALYANYADASAQPPFPDLRHTIRPVVHTFGSRPNSASIPDSLISTEFMSLNPRLTPSRSRITADGEEADTIVFVPHKQGRIV